MEMMFMTCARWFLGAVAAGLALGTAGAGAAPMPYVALDAPAPVQPVQFYYYGSPPPPPPVYYEPPRRRYYDDRPRYYRPAPRAYYGPQPQGYRVPTLSPGGRQGYTVIYDRDAAKDAMRDYRQTQKELYKERQRAWNRAHGY